MCHKPRYRLKALEWRLYICTACCLLLWHPLLDIETSEHFVNVDLECDITVPGSLQQVWFITVQLQLSEQLVHWSVCRWYCVQRTTENWWRCLRQDLPHCAKSWRITAASCKSYQGLWCIIQILTGAEVSTEKWCPEVV